MLADGEEGDGEGTLEKKEQEVEEEKREEGRRR